MRIYFAGPLFIEAERACLTALKQRIEKSDENVVVTWPWEFSPMEECSHSGVTLPKSYFADAMKRCRNAMPWLHCWMDRWWTMVRHGRKNHRNPDGYSESRRV